MMKILFLIIGGAIGTLLRYGLIEHSHRLITHSFPIGVLSVNILGSFFIGFFWSIAETFNFSANIRIFLFAGFFGGFTTFSTFALDSMFLFKEGAYKLAFLNIILSNLIGLIVVFLGFILGKNIVSLIK